MLSIQKCRGSIPDGDKCTDEEITKIRDDLYAFANIFFDMLIKKKRNKDRLT
jgi:hypothetical protein